MAAAASAVGGVRSRSSAASRTRRRRAADARESAARSADRLPLINSGRVALLDHSRLIAQLCGLERHTARSGRDSIDHGPKAHDDLATNAAAGALVLAAATPPGLQIYVV